MELTFDINFEGLISLKRLFNEITLDEYRLILKKEERSYDAYQAGKSFLKELKANSPLRPQDLMDELFEDGFMNIVVSMSNDEASALAGFVRQVTIIELEQIIKSKKIAKEANKALWIIKDCLQISGTNIDRLPFR